MHLYKMMERWAAPNGILKARQQTYVAPMRISSSF